MDTIKKCPIVRANGKLYDLGEFEKKHPGGIDLIQLGYGNDITSLIYSYHPNPEKIFNLLSTFKTPQIPETIPSSPYIFDSDFFKQLKKRVNQFFLDTRKARRGGLFIRSLILLFVSSTLYYLSLKVSWIFAPFFGISLACIGLCIHHDANHGAFSQSRRLNHITGLFGDVIGTSSFIWRYQHCLNHHTHCNQELDEDIRAAMPFMRLNEHQRRHGFMKLQHIYAPFLYAFTGMLYPISSIYEFMTRRHGTVEWHVVLKKSVLEFVLLKIFYLLYVFIIPCYVLGIAFIWKFYLPMQFAGGFYLASLFAVSHNNHKVLSASKANTSLDWATLQVINSANWSSSSLFWNIMSGGLNCQIEHHLFPGIAHHHYPDLHKIVKACCREFSIPYNDFRSFRSIFFDHISFLKKLGCKNEAKLS